MGEQIELVRLEQRERDEAEEQPLLIEQLKLRSPERRQVTFGAIEVEQLVSGDDPVRAIWELSGKLDLEPFTGNLISRNHKSGRRAWHPRLLVSIWIWAYSEGISSAREIERQSSYRPQLRWLCGLETVNHHTLSDFRVFHAEGLEILFTQVLAVLSQAGMVDLEQVAVDGTRVRSQGSTSSQRKRSTIQEHLDQARAAVKKLGDQGEDETANKRRAAARRRAARERVEQAEQALAELRRIEAAQSATRTKSARVSETEPQARLQRESNGGWATGYNAQLATDAKQSIVVGVELSNNASDAKQLTPTLDEVRRRLGRAPAQVLADKGYNSRANIASMERAGIEYATPAPTAGKSSQAAARAAGIQPGYEAKFFVWDEAADSFRCPAGKTLTYRRTSRKRREYRQYQGKRSDCRDCEFRMQCCPNSGWRTVSRSEEDALMTRHREWMGSERAKAAYRKRSQTAEFPNAWLKERFGVRKFRVKGLKKARAELLWAILAYNVKAWVRLVWRRPNRELTAAAAA